MPQALCPMLFPCTNDATHDRKGHDVVACVYEPQQEGTAFEKVTDPEGGRNPEQPGEEAVKEAVGEANFAAEEQGEAKGHDEAENEGGAEDDDHIGAFDALVGEGDFHLP